MIEKNIKIFEINIIMKKMMQKKEILLLKRELKEVNKSTNDYTKLIKYYKEKLVEYGAMRSLKNKVKYINGRYICNGRLSRDRVCTNK